jgi:hypothetical protein
MSHGARRGVISAGEIGMPSVAELAANRLPIPCFF